MNIQTKIFCQNLYQVVQYLNHVADGRQPLIFQETLRDREYLDRAERDANLEEIKEKFSQRGSLVMGMIKKVNSAYFKFIHVRFLTMQQFTLFFINESLNLLTNRILKKQFLLGHFPLLSYANKKTPGNLPHRWSQLPEAFRLTQSPTIRSDSVQNRT